MATSKTNPDDPDGVQYEGTPLDPLQQQSSYLPTDPTASAGYAVAPTQSPSADQTTGGPAPLAPGQRISSWQGYTPGGVEDAWGQFLQSKGYSGQADPYGFGAWGSAGAGTNLGALANEFSQQTGINARAVGNDKIDFGAQGGGVRDVIRNVDPSGAGQWWISGAGGGGGGAGGGGGGAAAATPVDTVTPATPVDPNKLAFGNSIRDQILKLLGQGPVSATDPEIAPAINAYDVQSQRALQRERDANAERLAAQGLASSGALDVANRQAMETAGEREAGFAGNAVMQQALARRQQISQLLQVGAGVMNADDQRALQLQLAQMDDAIRRLGISTQNQQFYDQLGLNAGMFQANLNRQTLLDTLFGG